MYGNPYTSPMFGQQMQNPYQARLDALQQPQMQQFDIIHVNGENGAKAFRMAPNSQCLLLDDTAPLVWLAQTDGAGYPSLTPYSITPYQPEQPKAATDLEDRLQKLEAIIYGQSDTSNAKPAKRSKTADATDTNAGNK